MWSSVLENEEEREEVDDPSHAERSLAPFLRTPLPPPELRHLPRQLVKGCPLGGALSHTSTRYASPASTTAVTPVAVVVVATLIIFATTPSVAVLAVRNVVTPLFLPVASRQLVRQSLARRRGRRPRCGPSVGP